MPDTSPGHESGQIPALQRVIAKYRRDVHYLPAGAAHEALTALEGHLRRPIPTALRKFLGTHNGAQLFRGALRIRSASDITPASEDAPQVVLFADTKEGVSWAWADDGRGGHVFGPWDGEALEPMHGGFDGWLSATINLLDAKVAQPDDRDMLRFEADPADVHQLVRAGVRALRMGDPDAAVRHLQTATRRAPDLAVAWQHLGDALAVSDRLAARQAWLRAFRATSLPLPWPGAPCIDPDLLRQLRGALRDHDQWEHELRGFLDDRVHDVNSETGVRIVVAVASSLADGLVAHGRRAQASQVLTDLVGRCRRFTLPITPWEATLRLARLNVDLGHHDEAEALLRRVRREGPNDLLGEAHLVLAQIAVTRQEPWAEEILADAAAAGLSASSQVLLEVVRAERAARSLQPEQARTHARSATEQAKALARPSLLALAQLAEGDAHRIAGQIEQAWATYDSALPLLDREDQPELRYRLHLRIGDLHGAAGQLHQALEHYHTAARGFHDHELPVREAWALLRVGKLEGNVRLVNAARDLFKAAGVAAGVAACDVHTGQPGASLAWHLEQASTHARARLLAQRARPPWDRSDADRPERRLGAHRIAVAACEEPIVAALSRELDACARVVATGRGRSPDPAVVRYIAAVDLLAGHRSWPAAKTLLNHLLQRTVDGPAYRALQGAICRSPNAAMVDGLLTCVERPEKNPAHAVAAATELLGLRRERASSVAIAHLAQAGGSPISRKAAVVALGRIGVTDHVDVLLEALDEPALAEQAALSLLMLGDRRGVDFHGRALAEHRLDLQGHPGEIVGRYGGPSHLPLLCAAAEGSDDRAMGALQGLGLLGDPRGVPTLLQALSNRDLRVVEVAAVALEILTGHHDPADNPGFKNRWHAWWEENAGKFPDGLRHRDGVAFDAALLIRRMTHNDRWARRTAYDELVITTGASLPFDSDGPWRVQAAHLIGWRRWWGKHKVQQPAGRWYLNGQAIG